MNNVGKVGKRNRNTGKHPSYVKLGLSEQAIKTRLAYDKERQNTPERIAYRVELNRKNRLLMKKGVSKIGDGKDVSHRKGYTSGGSIKVHGSTLEKASINRARRARIIK